MAKKTKVREHQRNPPARKSPPERDPAEQVRDWLRKENDKTQEGFREWETVTPERGKR